MGSVQKIGGRPTFTVIPPYLQGISATAIATITRDGTLTDGNMGFFRLLPGDMSATALLDVRSLFVNPRFDQFAARRADAAGGVVYEGIFNIGDPRSRAVSLRGTVYEHGQELLLVAEHDIARLEKNLATLRSLNDELAEKRREIARLERKLAHREATTEGAIADREVLLDILSQDAPADDTAPPLSADRAAVRGRANEPAERSGGERIQWTADMSTGVTVLDDEHHDLMGRHHGIVHAWGEDADPRHLASLLQTFVGAAAAHFAHEERVMKTTGFPLYHAHEVEHARLLKAADDFRASIDTAPDREDRLVIATYLREWLIYHMREQGKELREFICQ